MADITKANVELALSKVKHPAERKSITELGILDSYNIEGNKVTVNLSFKRTRDPMKNTVVKACVKSIQLYAHPEAEVEVNIIEPTEPIQPTQQPREKLRLAKHVLVVASGKGGVGKSTVSVNLAVGLAMKGYKVGLLDADIYGPSIPKMFDAENQVPEVEGEQGAERFLPIEKYGIKMTSIGFFVRKEDALVWRGPMATSALKQLMFQVKWGELDFLIIDMPPGTGDVHLTILQETLIDGAVVVSTPQEVALADVLKGINMFKSQGLSIPLLGIIENMAWFTPAELPNNRYYLFGKEGACKLAEREGIDLLGQIPLIQSVMESGDNGEPFVLKNRDDAEALHSIINKIELKLV